MKEVSVSKPISNDEIAMRAYYLWEQHGRPARRDLEFWSMAEAELMSRRDGDPGQGMMKSASAASRSPRRSSRAADAPAMPRYGEHKTVRSGPKRGAGKKAESRAG